VVVLLCVPDFIVVSSYALLIVVWFEAFLDARRHWLDRGSYRWHFHKASEVEWVVSFSILSRFGPRRCVLRERGHVDGVFETAAGFWASYRELILEAPKFKMRRRSTRRSTS